MSGFIYENYFAQFLSVHFVIREIVNLNLTFAVNVILRLFTIYKKFPENPVSGWKVKGTQLFGSFRWKISGSNGISEKVVLFFRTNC